MSNSKKTIFKGAATALITPFSKGRIDFDSMGKIIDFQIQNNISALVVSGTTGEAPTLSDRERIFLLEYVLERVNGRVPVIAGTGSNDTRHTLKMSKEATAVGCAALLIVTPYYNRANNRGLIENYLAVANNVRCPIIIYNVPSRTCVNIPLSVYCELAKHENIVGVKEASGNIDSIVELIYKTSDYLDIYSGNDSQNLSILSVGGVGTISVLSNILPYEVELLCREYFNGNINDAKELQYSQIELTKLLFSDLNPIPVKTAMSLMGFCGDEFRLPLCPASEELKTIIEKTLVKYNLLK